MTEEPQKKKSWIKRHPFLTTLGVIFALVQSLNFSGFCYSSAAFYDSQEMIDRAVQHTIDNQTQPHDIVYSSVADFHQQNPDCCEYHSWPLWGEEFETYIGRMFGFHISTVTLKFKKNLSGKEPYYENFLWLNSCGRVVETSGMPFSK